MDIQILHERDQIEPLLRRDVELNLYALGDLDDFFWPRTLWYARAGSSGLEHVVLVYAGIELPTVLAMAREADVEAMRETLRSLTAYLPRRFYLHISPGLEPGLFGPYRLLPRGDHLRMIWRERDRADDVGEEGIEALGPADADELVHLYAESYPGNWFDPRMLETGIYHGRRLDGRLICAAGVHVYSRAFSIAALGNITTAPGHRRKGHARAVTAALLRALDAGVIGLNVSAENPGAIRMYESLGLAIALPYREYMVELAIPSSLG